MMLHPHFCRTPRATHKYPSKCYAGCYTATSRVPRSGTGPRFLLRVPSDTRFDFALKMVRFFFPRQNLALGMVRFYGRTLALKMVCHRFRPFALGVLPLCVSPLLLYI